MSKTEETKEMAALCERGGMTLREIGGRYGVSKQTVSRRLARLDIAPAVRPPKCAQIDKSRLEHLYTTKRLPIDEIGETLNVPAHRIYQALDFYEIQKRESIKLNGKHKDSLKRLEIGQTAHIDYPAKNTYKNVHKSSKLAGIKISARKLGKGKYLVTRVA